MKTPLLYYTVALLFMVVSCNIINPAEKIPTYIQIDSVQLVSTVSGLHGSVSHKITDAWVYYERQLLGAFQLPARVPVLTEGRGQLQVVAGIWENGLSGTRVRNPFFTVDTFTFDPSPTQTIKHTPVFNYRTTDTPLVKYYVEGFEQGNSFVHKDGDTTLTKTNLPGEVFEGDWSAKVVLSDTTTSFESITSQEYLLPPGRECYMELNYKTEMPLLVRIEAFYGGSYIYSDVIGLNTKDNWTKIYINLTGFASTFQNAKFKIIIKGSLTDGVLSAKTFIDNFKIIYFN